MSFNANVGDMVRAKADNDIGRVQSVPSDKDDCYTIIYDQHCRRRYTKEQVEAGALRLLSRYTP